MKIQQCNSRGPCPEGYHGVDDHETGQCYSDETGCQYDNMVTNRTFIWKWKSPMLGFGLYL